MRKNLSLALVFLMLFGNIPTGLVEEENQPVEQATEMVYELAETPTEPADEAAESPGTEPAEESLNQAVASANTAESSTAIAVGTNEGAEVQEAVCICSADFYCCDVIALFEAGELPEDTELCPVCIIQVNGKLQLNGGLCECCKDYCKQKAVQSAEESGEGEVPSAEIKSDVSVGSQAETGEGQAEVSLANGESKESSTETTAENSEKATEEAAEENTEEAAEQSTASTAERTDGSTGSTVGEMSSTKSGKSGGKRSSGVKRSPGSKGAAKSKVGTAVAEAEVQGTESRADRAGSNTTWYRYQEFVNLDSLLLAGQAENHSGSLYIGKDFLLSNLQNTLLLSKDTALLDAFAGNTQGEIETLLLASEGEESSPTVVYVLAEEEGVELEHKFYTGQLAEGEAIIEEALPEGTLAKLLLAEDYLYLQNSEQVYVVALTEEALAGLQAQAGFEKALFLLLDREVLEGNKLLQVHISPNMESNLDSE